MRSALSQTLLLNDGETHRGRRNMIRIVQAVAAICVVAMTLTAETRQSKALELNLISSDGHRVPALDEPNHVCTVGSHYSVNLLTKAWRSVDTSAAPSCSSRPVTVDTDS